ncbi:MAG: hypothetical protein ACREYE_19145, partial [Gammaproteobacteria bacterium]
DIIKKIERARVKMEQIKPGSTLPRGKKEGGLTVKLFKGHYTSPPSEDPHREGGGDQDAVVFFSIRANNDVFYEVLDDDLKPIATLSMQDFVDLYSAQQASDYTRD